MRLTKRIRKKYVNSSQIFNYWTAEEADVHFEVEKFPPALLLKSIFTSLPLSVFNLKIFPSNIEHGAMIFQMKTRIAMIKMKREIEK